MKKKRDLFSHGFLAVASLFMLLSVTLAWFVNNVTADMTHMSLASQWMGVGAQVYPGTVDKALRTYDTATKTLQNTVTWGPVQESTKASVSIQGMVPGQCEYYMLLGSAPLNVYLENIKIDDVPVSGPNAAPLAQCLAFYLIPLEEAQAVLPQTVKEKATVTSILNRETAGANAGRLTATLLADLGGAGTKQVPSTGAAPGAIAQDYVLAVFCDPEYLQSGPGVAQIHQLTGNVSFSLTFATPK